MGEFAWGLYEPEEGKYDFDWMARAVDVMANAGLQVMLGTRPPLHRSGWPESMRKSCRSTRTASPCTKARARRIAMNSSVYWDYCKKIITQLANALEGIRNSSPGRSTTALAATTRIVVQ